MPAKNENADDVRLASAGQLDERTNWTFDPNERARLQTTEETELAYGMFYHYAGLLISASDQGITILRKRDSGVVKELPPVTTFSIPADNGHTITILIVRS